MSRRVTLRIAVVIVSLVFCVAFGLQALGGSSAPPAAAEPARTPAAEHAGPRPDLALAAARSVPALKNPIKPHKPKPKPKRHVVVAAPRPAPVPVATPMPTPKPKPAAPRYVPPAPRYVAPRRTPAPTPKPTPVPSGNFDSSGGNFDSSGAP
jgi:outer membrane biosynthesis protein TonB